MVPVLLLQFKNSEQTKNRYSIFIGKVNPILSNVKNEKIFAYLFCYLL